MIVSPWIPRGTVASDVFDHSSIVATVRKILAPGARLLTRRDERAATFDVVLTATAPREAPPPDLAHPTRAVEPAEQRSVASSDEQDAFSKQLDHLAEDVEWELNRRGAAQPEEAASDLVRQLHVDQVPHASTLARFEAEADRQRSG